MEELKMRKNVPAYTIVSCDFCGDHVKNDPKYAPPYINFQSAPSPEAWKMHTIQAQPKRYDLCHKCAKKMEIYISKSLL